MRLTVQRQDHSAGTSQNGRKDNEGRMVHTGCERQSGKGRMSGQVECRQCRMCMFSWPVVDILGHTRGRTCRSVVVATT